MSVSRILIVEDERLLSKDIARSLENIGYEIAGMVTTGEEAVQAVNMTEPDLIIMDINLAGDLDGIEAANLIREHHDTAVVYLTGYSEKTDLFERARATEPYGYLAKPLSHTDLHRTVEMALYRHHMEMRHKKTEELNRFILSNISEAVFTTDDRGEFTHVCANTEAIFGYSPQEVQALGNVTKLLGSGLFNPLLLAEQGELENLERKITDNAGKEHVLLVNVKRVSMEGGTVLYSCRDITKTKTMERELPASQKWYRLLEEMVNEGLWAVNADATTSWANTRMAHMFGTTVENMIGQPLFSFVTEEWRLEAKRFLAGLKEEKTEQRDFEFRRSDGSVLWAILSASPTFDEEGCFQGAYGAITDITERKSVENTLKQYSALLEGINEAQSKFISGGDPDQLFGGLLNSLLSLTQSEYGFIDEILSTKEGQPYREVRAITKIPWEASTQKLYEDRIATGFKIYGHESLPGTIITTGNPVISNNPATDPRRGGLPEGHPSLDSFLGLPLYSEGTLTGIAGVANRPGGYDGEIVEFLQPYLATCANIMTAYRYERRREEAEDALRESEEWFRTLFQQAADSIVLVNPDTHAIVDFNDIAHMNLGYSREEFGDLRVEDLEAIESSEGITDRAKLIQHFGRDIFETQLRTKNGEIRDFLMKVRSVSSGSQEFLLGIWYDITDRKRAEEQIRKALNEKEVLLREIHHRVKNNLAVIHSLLSLQSRYAKDDTLRDMFVDTQVRIRSMALAHEFLYQSENLAELNVREYVRKLASHLVTATSCLGTSISIESEIEDIALGLDSSIPLGIIITELVSNCVKHAFPDRVEGSIRLGLQSIGESEYELTVADDGVGFPAKVDVGKPKSLGLDIVDSFVDQLEGKMQVEANKGTVVRIRFRGRRNRGRS